MGSKNYLNVSMAARSNLTKNKQKSCESYDSSSSVYSQVSENSDNSVTNLALENSPKSQSAILNTDDSATYFNFASGEEHCKRSIWQKAVASFRSYKEKKGDRIRQQSLSSPCRSPRSNESQEIDPVYHLLKCAAEHTKCNKSLDGGSPVGCELDCLEKDKSFSGINLDEGCDHPACPCNQPSKLPVIKKEEFGLQTNLEPSMKRCPSSSPRQITLSSRSTSIPTASIR